MEKKYFSHFDELDVIDVPAPPMARQMFFGDKVLVGKNVIKAHTLIPSHSHPHEQISIVFSGECDVTIFLESGAETRHCVPGGLCWFPSNVNHEVLITSDEDCEIWDIFSPVREDWIPRD